MVSKRLAKGVLFVLSIPIVLLLAVCLVTGFVPYYIYQTRVRAVGPKLEELNQETLRRIPPPSGVTLFQSEISGRYTGQGDGRWLTLTYNKNSLIDRDIYEYYLKSLSPPDWNVDAGIGSGVMQIFANKGSDCVQIRIYREGVARQYQITIEHDLSQLVGPIPQDNLWFFDTPEVSHCP